MHQTDSFLNRHCGRVTVFRGKIFHFGVLRVRQFFRGEIILVLCVTVFGEENENFVSFSGENEFPPDLRNIFQRNIFQSSKKIFSRIFQRNIFSVKKKYFPEYFSGIFFPEFFSGIFCKIFFQNFSAEYFFHITQRNPRIEFIGISFPFNQGFLFLLVAANNLFNSKNILVCLLQFCFVK